MIILETLFVIIAGCLLHFIYHWTKGASWLKWFAATNESVFEHIKITTMPMIFTMLVDYWLVGGYSNYFLGKFLAILMVWILMPTLFYMFKKVLGRAVLWIDISCFVLIVVWAGLLFNTILCLPAQGLEILGGVGLIVFFAATVAWSYFPPKLGLFAVPDAHEHSHAKRSKKATAKK